MSDPMGGFRLSALSPGYYDVTAVLDGFQSVRFERVEVLLGQIKRLDVSGASPLVDVRQSARAVSLRQDLLEHLPSGVDYRTVAAILPGANNEPRLGGLSIDGSSAAENRFIVDGVDTTNAMTGARRGEKASRRSLDVMILARPTSLAREALSFVERNAEQIAEHIVLPEDIEGRPGYE